MEIKLIKFSKKFITKEYIAWLNNKNLNKYSRLSYKKNSKRDVLIYLNLMKKNLFYAIVLKKNNKHIGNISAYLDKYNKTADLSILLAYQKRGYGFAAWKEIIIKITSMKYRKVTAGAMSINTPMIKLFKKSGMKFEYKKKKHFIYKNKLIDLVGYYKFI
tara:strand:+ start:3396 stop:3875 length:480 start_codon:yes stop_codon:yes gene_type:complete